MESLENYKEKILARYYPVGTRILSEEKIKKLKK
jgi:hypothetical protein